MKRFEVPTKDLRLDYIGSILIAIASLSLILFVTWGGEKDIGYPWDSIQIVILVITFSVALILFIVQEYYHRLPTLQLRLYKIRNVWINLFIAFFVYYALFTVVNYMAVYFQVVLGDIPVMSGLKLGGFVTGFVIASRSSGKILTCTSKANIVMGLAGIMLAVGLGVMSFITPTINYGYIFLFTLLMGLGIGFLVPSTGAWIQLSVPQREIAVAMSNFSFHCYLGGCVGITVSGTIFERSMYKYSLQGYTAQESVTKGLIETFFWCIPPIAVASILGFFIHPIKEKRIKERPQLFTPSSSRKDISVISNNNSNSNLV